MATILIVDDDTAILSLLDSILADESGHTVVTASNGQEALQRLSAEPIDVIVCDINMPVMDGIEFVHALRNDVAYKDIPVVMISAIDNPERIEPELDVDLMLEKPFEVNALIACVSFVLGRVRASQSSIRVTRRKASTSVQHMLRIGRPLNGASDPATG